MEAPAAGFRSHLTLALCTLLHGFTHAYGTMLVPLYLPMRDELGLGGLGWASLIVTVYGLVYCLGSYPAGVLADRGNRKVLLGAGLIVNALAILLMGLTHRYEMLILFGVLAGLAGTLFHPAANALSTAHYPRSPGMAIGVLSIGAGIGFFAGPRYAGWRAEVAGWQAPLVEAGLFGIVCGVLFLLVAREARKDKDQGGTGAEEATARDRMKDEGGAATARDRMKEGGPGGNGNGSASSLSLPPSSEARRAPLGPGLRWRVAGVAAVLAGRDFAGIASLSLASIYLQKARGLSVGEAGLIVGSMMLIAIVANPIAVYLSPGRRRLPMLAAVLVAGGAIIATVPFVPVAYALPVLCVFQACHLGSYAVSEAAMLERVDPAVRGRVIGIFLTIAGTIASASPWLMGAWVDAMGASAFHPRAYALPFGTLGVLLVLAALSVFLIRRLGETPARSPREFEPVMSSVNPATLEVVG
jgi:FSR family fosmidomycin resistance protein-like MFS transporter